MPLLEGSEENPASAPRSVYNSAELELEGFLHRADFTCERNYANPLLFSCVCLLLFCRNSGKGAPVLLHYELTSQQARPVNLSRSRLEFSPPAPSAG